MTNSLPQLRSLDSILNESSIASHSCKTSFASNNPISFFTGWHQPTNGDRGTKYFEKTFISIRRLWKRKSYFTVQDWILDSGAFKELELNGDYTFTIKKYADAIIYWSKCGNMLAAVALDFMCEKYIFDCRYKYKNIRYTVKDHQHLTVAHYDKLRKLVPENIYIMPVIQGFTLEEYVDCIDLYGDRLKPGMWVGVGSVCKRQGNPKQIEEVLLAIYRRRPDLKLHGFGIKSTALSSVLVVDLLYSADSAAGGLSQSKGKKRVNCNDPKTALEYELVINNKIQNALDTKAFRLSSLIKKTFTKFSIPQFCYEQVFKEVQSNPSFYGIYKDLNAVISQYSITKFY